MPVAAFFGIIGLIILMNLSGYALVPESESAGLGDSVSGPTISRATPTPVAAASVPEPVVETAVTSLSPQDITQTSAVLRGRATVGDTPLNNAFFVYAYSRSDLQAVVNGTRTYAAVQEQAVDGVRVRLATRQVRTERIYDERITSLAPDTRYYTQWCAETSFGLLCAPVESFTTYESNRSFRDLRRPTISQTDYTLLSGDEVSFTARVNMGDTVDGRVYLVYGESQRLVEQAAEADEVSDIDEDDEDLQRIRVESNLRGTRTFTTVVDDLNGETDHYFTWCVSFDGDDDGFLCDDVQSFETPGDEFGKEPAVTLSAVASAVTQAVLSGSVRMREFNNGYVFFAYGTDRSRITDIAGEQSFSRVRQSGDRLQTVVVDGDLDGNDTYTEQLRDLLPDETYYVSLCVEFENEDEDRREVDFIACSEVEEFVTG